MRYERHPLDIGSLVIGLICLGIVTAWLLPTLGLVTGGEAAWLLPASLIVAGGVGIALAALRERGEPTQETGWPDQPVTDWLPPELYEDQTGEQAETPEGAGPSEQRKERDDD